MSSTDFLAIGLLLDKLDDPTTAHAVYIKSYNTRTREVQTINSWGDQGEFGPRNRAGQLTLRGDGVLKDEDFYAVCHVGLLFYQETDLFYWDTKLLIASPFLFKIIRMSLLLIQIRNLSDLCGFVREEVPEKNLNL